MSSRTSAPCISCCAACLPPPDPAISGWTKSARRLASTCARSRSRSQSRCSIARRSSVLTDRIEAALAAPIAQEREFDTLAALDEVLAGIGLGRRDIGGEVTFRGVDPIVPSTLRLAAAAGIGLVAKSVAVAKLWRLRGGNGQDISIDLRVAPHRLCPFYDRRWELLAGYPPGAPASPSPAFGFGFYRTA